MMTVNLSLLSKSAELTPRPGVERLIVAVRGLNKPIIFSQFMARLSIIYGAQSASLPKLRLTGFRRGGFISKVSPVRLAKS